MFGWQGYSQGQGYGSYDQSQYGQQAPAGGAQGAGAGAGASGGAYGQQQFSQQGTEPSSLLCITSSFIDNSSNTDNFFLTAEVWY